MKKILLLIILLIIPINIFGKEIDLKVDNISLVKKSKSAEIINEPTYSNLDLNIEVKLQEKGDYVKYKIDLINNTNETYILNYNHEDKNKYVDYKIKFEKEDKIIEENGITTFFLTITKVKEIENSKYKDNTYIGTSDIDFKLISKKEFIKNNPKIKNSMQIVIGLLLLIFLVLGIISLKKSKKSILLLIIVILLITPIVIKAIDEEHLRIRIIFISEKN